MSSPDFKIALTGASGFIGSRLQKRFPGSVILGRNDGLGQLIHKLEGVYAVINLAGAPLIRRWTASYKEVLRNSRIDTTRRVVRAINQSDVKMFISTSAVGIYPDDTQCDETCTELASDFLGSLCQEWEREARRCNKKVAIFRLGVVLGPEGGALKQMLLPFKLGLGGPIASGDMITSWIDIHDLIAAYEFVLDRGLQGVFNLVAPNPVSNREFTRALAKALGRPAFLPIPRFVLRLIYGEAASVLTASKIVYPARLLKEGFTFKYPTIEGSLNHLLASKP